MLNPSISVNCFPLSNDHHTLLYICLKDEQQMDQYTTGSPVIDISLFFILAQSDS